LGSYWLVYGDYRDACCRLVWSSRWRAPRAGIEQAVLTDVTAAVRFGKFHRFGTLCDGTGSGYGS